MISESIDHRNIYQLPLQTVTSSNKTTTGGRRSVGSEWTSDTLN